MPSAVCPMVALSQLHSPAGTASQPRAHLYKLAALRPRLRTKPSGSQGIAPQALASAPCIIHPSGWSLPCTPHLSLPNYCLFPGRLCKLGSHTHKSFSAILETDITMSSLWFPNILYPSPMGPGGLGEAHQGRLSPVQPPFLSRRAAASLGLTGAVLGVCGYTW